jgi:electron transport complex protein RnfB
MAKDKGKPVFNYEECVACTSCMEACPFECIEMTKQGVNKRYKTKAYPHLVKVEECTGCELCSKQCPVDSITLMAAAA